MPDRLVPLESKELLTDATISAVYYHPLKAGRRQRIDKAILTPRGIKHDRELMVVDEDSGYMCSLRFDPLLALITTNIGDELITMSAEGVTVMNSLKRDGKCMEVTVHNTKGIKAVDQGDTLSNFVSDVIDKRVRVVRMADDYHRLVKPEYVIDQPSVTNEVGFADGAPLLLTAQVSADQVNKFIQEDTPGYPKIVPIDNYRGNIEIDGFGFPFAEDLIAVAQSGNVKLHFKWLCSRCEVTTTNQTTGERNPKVGQYIGDPEKGVRQPIYSLVKHRAGEYFPGKFGALFGVNLIPEFLNPESPYLEKGAKLQIIARK